MWVSLWIGINDLSGGGMFVDENYFDFGFDFLVVEQFYSGYFADGWHLGMVVLRRRWS